MKPVERDATFSPNVGIILTALLLLAVTVVAVGCGDSKFRFAPVSGQIFLDGEPVSNARVVFMPRSTREDDEAGPYSNGETDEEGRYTLMSVDESPRRGAVVGPHNVIVSTRRSHLDPEDPDIEIIDVPEAIPRIYTHYRLTPLNYEVPPEGTESADFQLQSKQRR